MRFPAWVWPHTQKVQTTWAVRLGRVIHWTFTGYAAFAVFAIAVATIRISLFAADGEFDFEFWAMPFIAVTVFMMGRAFRFIVAGE